MNSVECAACARDFRGTAQGQGDAGTHSTGRTGGGGGGAREGGGGACGTGPLSWAERQWRTIEVTRARRGYHQIDPGATGLEPVMEGLPHPHPHTPHVVWLPALLRYVRTLGQSEHRSGAGKATPAGPATSVLGLC